MIVALRKGIRVAQAGVAVRQRAAKDCPADGEAGGDEGPGQGDARDPEGGDLPGGPQGDEDREPYGVLADPDPAGPTVGAQQVGVAAPAGLLAEDDADDDAAQRPAQDDADGPAEGAGGVGEDLDEEEVLGPP